MQSNYVFTLPFRNVSLPLNSFRRVAFLHLSYARISLNRLFLLVSQKLSGPSLLKNTKKKITYSVDSSNREYNTENRCSKDQEDVWFMLHNGEIETGSVAFGFHHDIFLHCLSRCAIEDCHERVDGEYSL